MSSAGAKFVVGRQAALPLKRAFRIALNSLKIRFWRSIITAGGIFLGIAFFTVVWTQSLMQWPVPQKIDPGYVRLDGQVLSPNDYNVWKPIPVKVGLDAGIPADVIERVAGKKDTFDLGRIVRGRINARRADKKVARLTREWKALSRIQSKLAFFLDVLGDKEIKPEDAGRFGVPRKLVREAQKIAREAGRKKGVVYGSDLADVLREESRGIPTLYVAAALDQDISIKDALGVGVPLTVAKQLAGEGRTFKATPLNDLITGMPDQIKKWRKLKERNAIYRTVSQAAIDKLDRRYAVTLGEVLERARGFSRDARKGHVMIVNTDRRVAANFDQKAAEGSRIKLNDGDYILVPDVNSYYRLVWLVVMSLLVCTVGISNSMLMSVTERFKEIGTMKCLGALDSFVVMLFMLESGMLGIVASVLGWVIGFISIVLIAGMTTGWDLVANIEFAGVVQSLGMAVVIGLLLTIVATIAPALKAAGMPAAVALRSEI